MTSILSKNIKKLSTLFNSNKVNKVYVFGSVLREDFNKDSDIDIIIDFQPNLDPIEKGELWWKLYDELRSIFKREVDIINEKKLKNPFFIQEINNTKKLIYER
ncbi:MAG: nucleotidyltransferase domain-containing protein [Flavobacteriales bacterium]|nr:nucleotidyltransferase domain-containing protein [Flavobacteriales bacterium]